MRYHTYKPEFYSTYYGQTYICNHPVYSRCTLFKKNDIGLAVIQQRYDAMTKCTYWNELDDWIPDLIYKNERFPLYFAERAGNCENGLYPTVSVRQIMHSLKMKPLKRERWETLFDRRMI